MFPLLSAYDWKTVEGKGQIETKCHLLQYCDYMTMLLPVILEDHLKLLSSNRVGDAKPVSSVEV